MRSAEQVDAEGDVEPRAVAGQPHHRRPAPSSQCAIARPPTSNGRSPRPSMNADTLALARASSPAKPRPAGGPGPGRGRRRC